MNMAKKSESSWAYVTDKLNKNYLNWQKYEDCLKGLYFKFPVKLKKTVF